MTSKIFKRLARIRKASVVSQDRTLGCSKRVKDVKKDDMLSDSTVVALCLV